jgi:putative oxidoreductase
MTLALLLLRLVVGLSFVAHGGQKLFGWFGGGGPRGTSVGFASLGFKAPLQMAVMAGLGEFGGGCLLAAGLVTPFAAFSICSVMIVAVVTSHLRNGYWVYKGGYELNVAYAAVALAAVLAGPGAWSLDRAIGWEHHLRGLGVTGIVVCAAALSGFATLFFFRNRGERVTDSAPV